MSAARISNRSPNADIRMQTFAPRSMGLVSMAPQPVNSLASPFHRGRSRSPVARYRTEQLRYKSRMSEITKDTQATLHQLVAGEDTIKEEGRLGELVLRY